MVLFTASRRNTLVGLGGTYALPSAHLAITSVVITRRGYNGRTDTVFGRHRCRSVRDCVVLSVRPSVDVSRKTLRFSSNKYNNVLLQCLYCLVSLHFLTLKGQRSRSRTLKGRRNFAASGPVYFTYRPQYRSSGIGYVCSASHCSFVLLVVVADYSLVVLVIISSIIIIIIVVVVVVIIIIVDEHKYLSEYNQRNYARRGVDTDDNDGECTCESPR